LIVIGSVGASIRTVGVQARIAGIQAARSAILKTIALCLTGTLKPFIEQIRTIITLLACSFLRWLETTKPGYSPYMTYPT
jgi:hypothetical protein